MEAFEDNVTEEYVDNPVTTIQSIPISSTLSSNLHITECPLCECTCPTLSPIMKIHPTPSGESSLNSTSIHLLFCMTLLISDSAIGILVKEIDQNYVEEMEEKIHLKEEAYNQLEPEVILRPTNEQEGMFIY